MSIIRIQSRMLEGTDGVKENWHSTEFCQIRRSSNGTCSFHLTPKRTNWLSLLSMNGRILVIYLVKRFCTWPLALMFFKKRLMKPSSFRILRIHQDSDTRMLLDQSNHQESDTRMLLHARHPSISSDKIIISSPDTDAFMIMLSRVTEMNGQLFMLTGTSSKRRTIDVNSIAEVIYENQNETYCMKNEVMKTLLGFHCLKRCDTVSSFSVRGKLKPLKLLFKNGEYVDAFSSLGKDNKLNKETAKKLERFDYICIGKSQRSPCPWAICCAASILKEEERHLLTCYLLVTTCSHHTTSEPAIKRIFGNSTLTQWLIPMNQLTMMVYER